MFDFSLEIMLGVAALLISTAATAVMWISVRDARKGGGLVSRDRAFYEQQISELVERLVAAPDRWQEVNHLVLSGQQAQSDAIQVFSPHEIPLLVEQGLADEDLSIDPGLIFVLAPVRLETENVYAHIKNIARDSFAMRVDRADLLPTSGSILRQVVSNIAKARIIIADVGSRNPNVYYELGIAHTLGKPTILISRNVSEVSFDVVTNRVIVFSSYYELGQKLEEAIDAALKGQSYHSGR
jgi:hypothetical protein